MEVTKRFFADVLGATVIKVGTNNQEIVRMPNAFIFLRAQKPTGGNKGTAMDHIGISVPDLPAVLAKVKAAGYRVATAAEAMPGIHVNGDIGTIPGAAVSGVAFVFGPDELKVELVELKTQTAPIASHHLHFAGLNRDMQAWYMKTFGAVERTPSLPGAFETAALPGLTMNFNPVPEGVPGTQGRVLDHVGFEVKGLEAFVKKLEADGVKLASPMRQVPALGITVAFFTDPWGTYIELTEGLDKIQ